MAQVKGKTAVVVGAAGGIGAACAGRLAEAGFGVVAVGRDKPGRAEAVVAELNARGGGPHEFRGCDAFSLKDVKDCADGIVKDKGTIDALVMSQGMATVQGFTPTVVSDIYMSHRPTQRKSIRFCRQQINHYRRYKLWVLSDNNLFVNIHFTTTPGRK